MTMVAAASTALKASHGQDQPTTSDERHSGAKEKGVRTFHPPGRQRTVLRAFHAEAIDLVMLSRN